MAHRRSKRGRPRKVDAIGDYRVAPVPFGEVAQGLKALALPLGRWLLDSTGTGANRRVALQPAGEGVKQALNLIIGQFRKVIGYRQLARLAAIETKRHLDTSTEKEATLVGV